MHCDELKILAPSRAPSKSDLRAKKRGSSSFGAPQNQSTRHSNLVNMVRLPLLTLEMNTLLVVEDIAQYNTSLWMPLKGVKRTFVGRRALRTHKHTLVFCLALADPFPV